MAGRLKHLPEMWWHEGTGLDKGQAMIEVGSTVVLRTTRAVYTTCKVVSLNRKAIEVSYVVADALELVRGKLVLTHRRDMVAARDVVDVSERV